jgi:hypothetical protein
MSETQPQRKPSDLKRGWSFLEVMFGGSGGTILQILAEAREHHEAVHHHGMKHIYALLLFAVIALAYHYGRKRRA